MIFYIKRMNTHLLAHGIVSWTPDLNSRNRLFVMFLFFFCQNWCFFKGIFACFSGANGNGKFGHPKKGVNEVILRQNHWIKRLFDQYKPLGAYTMDYTRRIGLDVPLAPKKLGQSGQNTNNYRPAGPNCMSNWQPHLCSNTRIVGRQSPPHSAGKLIVSYRNYLLH